jgi:hypothetical protein
VLKTAEVFKAQEPVMAAAALMVLVLCFCSMLTPWQLLHCKRSFLIN